MSKITITNSEDIINAANGINVNLEDVHSVYVSLDYILKELNEFWAANKDQQDFAQGLTEHIERLKAFRETLDLFQLAIKEFINLTEETGSRKVEGGIN